MRPCRALNSPSSVLSVISRIYSRLTVPNLLSDADNASSGELTLAWLSTEKETGRSKMSALTNLPSSARSIERMSRPAASIINSFTLCLALRLP